MSVAIARRNGKRKPGRGGTPLLDILAKHLDEFVWQAAAEGLSLDDVEGAVLDRVLTMREAAINLFLELQGDGDLGRTVTTEEGVTLSRSDEPVEQPLQTVFGRHSFGQFVYSPKSLSENPLHSPQDSANQGFPADSSRFSDRH